MKNTIKIIILAVSFAGVSALILVFINTKLKPPTKVDYTNQFLPQIESLTEGLDGKSETTFTLLNDKFFTFTELKQIYEKNRLLDDSEISLATEKFVTAYNPAYANECLAYFSHMRWDDAILGDMETRLAELKGLSPDIYSSGSKLKTVSEVLNDYHSAMALTRKNYKNLNESITNRKLTDQYAAKPYLHNNKYLLQQMEEAMKRQGRQHYDEIAAEVSNLDCYLNNGMTMTKYNSISSAVADDLNGYDNNASKIYGQKLDVDRLNKDISDYRLKAIKWFNRSDDDKHI